MDLWSPKSTVMGEIQQYCNVSAIYDPNSHNNGKTFMVIIWKGPVQGFHRHDSHSIAGLGGKTSLKESCSHVTYQKKDLVER